MLKYDSGSMYGVRRTAGMERWVDNSCLCFSQLNVVFVFIVDVLCFALLLFLSWFGFVCFLCNPDWPQIHCVTEGDLELQSLLPPLPKIQF